MVITVWNGRSFDTAKDLTAAERHILQKLFAWKTMVKTAEEFKAQTQRALEVGWNDSGPVAASPALDMIIQHLEREVAARLKDTAARS